MTGNRPTDRRGPSRDQFQVLLVLQVVSAVLFAVAAVARAADDDAAAWEPWPWAVLAVGNAVAAALSRRALHRDRETSR